MKSEIGCRLKTVREKYGFSQRQLAQRSGVTNGTISLIEQNRISPSVASLRSILGGIPMTLAEFFSLDDLPPAEQIFFRAQELVELTKGISAASRGSISLHQVGDPRRRNLQVLYERYEPGADTGAAKNMLQHDSEEGGIIVEGEIELTVGDEKTVLRAGDAYLFDSRKPHRFRNIGDQACILVSACTPPYL